MQVQRVPIHRPKRAGPGQTVVWVGTAMPTLLFLSPLRIDRRTQRQHLGHRWHLPTHRHRARAADRQPRLHHGCPQAELPAARRHLGQAVAGVLRYAIAGASGERAATSPWTDLSFLLGFALIGAAALYPSVVDLPELRFAAPVRIDREEADVSDPLSTVELEKRWTK
jgi:hypothetical protein